MAKEYTKEQKELFAKMRVVILSPVMHSEPKFWKSVVNLVAYSWSQGLKIEELGITERSVVDWARNDLARAGLAQKGALSELPYTHFLWLDTDHVFNPEMACELAIHDKDAISALYYNRTEPHLPVCYVKDFSEDEYKHFPLIVAPSTVFEVDACGFGGLLTKREIFEITPEPWFTIDYRAGEDIAFCVKARKFGVTFWVHGGYRMGHIGEPKIITHKEYLEHQELNKDKFADKIRVSLGGTKDGII
jgi:hypothetical protein